MVGGSSLGIGLTMFLRDQFTGPAARIKASSQELYAQMRKMQEDQLRYQRNLNLGLAFGGAMAMRGMGRQIKKAAEYGYEMEFVKSITDANVTKQKELMDTAEKLAGLTMFYPQDIAEGMRFMAMAGMDADQVLQNITGSVNLAGATMANLGGKGGAADIMTNVMKQFGIDFKYTTDVADRLAYGVTRANTNLFDLGEALKYAGATAMDLNITLDESVAMVMALGNAGMQGSMAGVAMENALRYMARAVSDFGSGPSQKALGILGISVKDLTDQSGNLLSMTEVMGKFRDAIDRIYQGGENVQSQAILQSIFGVRGKRAASLFLRNYDEFKRFAGLVATESGGHAKRIMEDMMSTLEGELKKLTSEIQSMWIAFTATIDPILKGFVKVFKVIVKVISTILKIPLAGEFLGGAIAGFIALKTVSFAYKGIVAGLRLMHVQAGASATTMAATSSLAWSKMAAAARKYGMVSGAVMSTVPWTRGHGAVGYHPTGLFGKPGYVVRAPGGGHRTFGSAAKASKVAREMYGARAMGAGMMMNLAAKSAAGKMVPSLLGRLLGVLGGPLGMVLAFTLPGLISLVVGALKRGKDSTDANTKELKKNNLSKAGKGGQFTVMEHAIKFIGGDTVSKLQGFTDARTGEVTYRTSEISTDLRRLIEAQRFQPIILNVQLDGDTIFSKQIDAHLQKQSDFREHNIGLY